MAQLTRDPEAAEADHYDAIIVGGGIHGAAIAYELATRRIRALLIERADFGSGTTANWLRIVHGGLRYLQSLDLPRFFDSVAARRKWLRDFPQLVEPLPCLMPLYGRGMKRNSILRAALAANEILSAHRNQGVDPERHLAPGRVLGPRDTETLAPGLLQEGLQGGALWFDGTAPDANRLFMAVLRRAAAHVTMLNYVEATGLEVHDGKVAGVRAADRVSGREHLFRAPVVLNLASPWAPEVARRFASSREDMCGFTIAWNVVLARKPISRHALAVTPARKGGQVFFVVPCRDRLLAGTGHASWTVAPDEPIPGEQLLHDFVSELAEALPALELSMADVRRVYSGLQPATAPGAASMADRPTIIDHGRDGGAKGLHSLVGVKYTTALNFARNHVGRIFPDRRRESEPAPDPGETPALATTPPAELLQQLEHSAASLRESFEKLARDEAVMYLDDLILRRTQLSDDPDIAQRAAAAIGTLIGWDEERIETGRARLAETLERRMPGSAIPH